jgi:hypothetical protein
LKLSRVNVGKRIKKYPWVAGIVLMTIFVIFFVELMAMRLDILGSHSRNSLTLLPLFLNTNLLLRAKRCYGGTRRLANYRTRRGEVA